MWHCNQPLNHNRNLQQASRNRLPVTVRMVRPLTLNLSCPACLVDLEDRTGVKFFAEKKQSLPRETYLSFLFNWSEFNRGTCEPLYFLGISEFQYTDTDCWMLQGCFFCYKTHVSCPKKIVWYHFVNKGKSFFGVCPYSFLWYM